MSHMATARQNLAVVSETDPYYSNVSLLLHMDGSNGSTNFIDNSGSPKTVTVGGNTKISTAESKFGGSSALFDASNDWLFIATASTYDWLTASLTSWTIECWFNVPNVTGTKNLVSKGTNNTTQAAVLCNVSGNGVAVSFFKSSAYGGVGSVSTNTLTANTWNHYAAVYNADDRSLRVFLNGVMGTVVTLEASSNYSVPNGNGLRIGEYSSGDFDYSGYIDEFRITQGVARYTTNFTPPTQAFPDQGPQTDPFYYNTSLLLHFVINLVLFRWASSRFTFPSLYRPTLAETL